MNKLKIFGNRVILLLLIPVLIFATIVNCIWWTVDGLWVGLYKAWKYDIIPETKDAYNKFISLWRCAFK